MRRILPTSAVRGSRNRPPRRLPTASVAAFALLALGACAGESTMPPSGGDAQQQQQQQYDTGAIPTYDSYVFPDTGGGGQEDAGTSTFADTGSGQQDAGASATKPPATCSSSGLRISEVAVGTLDFVVLKNNGSGPIDLLGYKLEMYGINGNKPVEHTFEGTVRRDRAAGADA